MTQQPFDPYRKWLGIPPRDQPPNHYRLLGIEVFESDPDVISNAADGRMGQIRTFQTGRHSEWSQRLLNEIAAARVCLLNEEKKAAYDNTLRQQLGAQNAPPLVPPRPASPPVAPPEIRSHHSVVPRVVPSASNSGPFSRRHLPGLVAVAATAVVAVVLAVLLLKSGGEPDVRTSPDVKPDAGVAIQNSDVDRDAPVKPDETLLDGHEPPANRATVDGTQPDPTMDVPPDTAIPEQVAAEVDGMPANVADDVDPGMTTEPPPTSQATVDPTPQPLAPQPPKPSIEPPDRPDHTGLGDLMKPPSRSVPVKSDVEDARRRIREIFKDDFDSSESPAAKLALAAKLRRQGLDANDDPVVRFAFLKMAADLAATAADPGEAFKAVDAIKEHYDADALQMKADVLTQVAGLIRGGEAGAYLALLAALLAEEAVARDDYKMADRLFNLGEVAAKKANAKIIASELAAREREVARTARAYAPVEKALAVLAENPLDSKANDEVGRWHCFEKNDWPRGLAYLAKAENTALAELAQRDLATQGNLLTPDQQRQLGDGWWELSENERGVSKAAYMCRAVHWYQKALSGITGLDKAAIAKRVETAGLDKNVVKSPTWGAVEEGNVALATNGTTVEGVENHPERLLDGNFTVRQCAGGKCPCQWVITLAKPYRLKEIRFRLWDIEPSVFRYAILTSPDGKEFLPLADRSQGNWKSWQQFRFPSRLVKSVKIIGVFSSVNQDFMVREFEAYCIPPETPPDTAAQ